MAMSDNPPENLVRQAEINLFTFVFGQWSKLGNTKEEAWGNLPEEIKLDIKAFVAKYPPGSRKIVEMI